MTTADNERLFPTDRMTKRERVLATMAHKPIDRVALHDQLSYNPRVIADWSGRALAGFDYTSDDVGAVVRRTLDATFPIISLCGTDTQTTPDGFVVQNDNWTSWRVSRPFQDEHGARDWLLTRLAELKARRRAFDAAQARATRAQRLRRLQSQIGETVIIDFCWLGFSSVFDAMGLEIFTFFCQLYEETLAEYLAEFAAQQEAWAHAVADADLSPIILIPEDFATKQGPIFPPDFLDRHLFGYVARLAAAWRDHGVHVLFHSDGNYRKAIPRLRACGVEGFYCLEKNCGMDIVDLKTRWPEMVWAGGVDGVDLMERGTPPQVRVEVRRHILETRALETGGMFVGSSSEINPPIPPENFRAMVAAVGEIRNTTM